MNKKINYTLEYLAKSEDKSNFYQNLLSFFNEKEIYTQSKYELKTLTILANRANIELPSSYEDGIKNLDKLLESNINSEINSAKKQLLETILQSNFKKKKEDLDKVETSIYKCLTAYIYGLTRSLELFYIYTKDDLREPELFIEYSSKIHQELIDTIFNKEEKELLAEKLKEIMGVYLTLYARYLYV